MSELDDASDLFAPSPPPPRRVAREIPHVASPSAGRPLPYSEDAERILLGSMLLDPHSVVAVLLNDLQPEEFYLPTHRALYEAILAIARRLQIPATWNVAEWLHQQDLLDAVGGVAFIETVANSVSTTAHWQQSLAVVRERAARRALIRQSALLAERAYREEFLDLLPAVDHLHRSCSAANLGREFPGRKPSTFVVPPPNDPSSLLGTNRYVSRGDGGTLVSTSGVGKSVISVQLSYSWALGLPGLGIQASRAHRILYVQSEDADGDVAECCESCRYMMKLTDQQLESIDRNLCIIRNDTDNGDAFIRSLREYVQFWKPDIVILNPLQAYAGCDISDAREMGNFLRRGLNGVNREKQFAYFIVHHTPKPAVRNAKDKSFRQWNEVMYEAAGSAELINWSRFIITLKARSEPRKFDMVLAKRGSRAGVVIEKTSDSGVPHYEHVTTVPIRYSDEQFIPRGTEREINALYWLPLDEPPAPAVESGKATERGGKTQYDIERMLAYFPRGESEAKPLGQIARKATEDEGMGKSSFYRIKEDLCTRGLIFKTPEGLWFRGTG